MKHTLELPSIENYEQITPHFNTFEARCRGENCCSGSSPMVKDIWLALEQLRAVVKSPLVITSGYRCLTHNRSIRDSRGRKLSKDSSQHCKGTAVDILIPNGINPHVFFEYCKQVFNGTGLYKNFVHVDLRSGRRATWYGGY